MRLTAALIFLTGMFLATARGEYRINATFTLKARHQQVVVVSFSTFSQTVNVGPGERVQGFKTVLGTL